MTLLRGPASSAIKTGRSPTRRSLAITVTASISVAESRSVVANSTITNNIVGIYSRDGTTLTNSIVSGNAGVDKSTTSGGDIFGSLNAATSRNNLIGNAAYAGGLTNGVNGNILGVADPGLGALANNGGPTETCRVVELQPGY